MDYLKNERGSEEKTLSIWDEDDEWYEFDFASQLVRSFLDAKILATNHSKASAAHVAEDVGDLNSGPYFTPDPAKYGDAVSESHG